MRAVVITKHGSPDVLQVEQRPSPEPGAGQVLVQVEAAGINFADLMARVGLYASAPKPPCIVGYEVAGTVTELGEGVEGIEEGQRVMAGTRFGGYASQVAANAGDVLPLPDSLSFEEGAAIPVNYLTAWLGLVRFGNVWSGERVLLHAAAGGVGIAATQIAKRLGAEVWGTSSPGKHDAIRGFGVDHPLDYTKSDWEQGLPTFDLIMDAVGGKSFKTSYELLRAGGRLVCFGASSVMSGEKRNLLTAGRAALAMPKFGLIKQMETSKAVIGLNSLALWDELGSIEQFLDPMRELLEDGTIKPVVAKAFPFDEAPAAHRYIGERHNVGKVVLTP